MRKLTILTFFIACHLVQGQKSEFKELPTFIDSLFQKGLDEGLIPGGIIGVVYRGELIHGKAYGLSNVEQRKLVDFESTKFQLGSMGKLLTAMAVLKEVQRGRLDLHRDVNDYLTEFKLTTKAEAPITLHHLLTHTAGLNERVIGYASQSPGKQEDLAQHLKQRMPTVYTQPGVEVSYSNYGFGMAGHLIEISSGQKFQDYIQAEILTPLALYQTTYAAPEPVEDFATGYKIKEGFRPVEYLSRHVVPAGSISSTGADLSKLVLALLNQDSRLLDSLHFALFTSEQFNAHPLLSGQGYGFEMQNFNGYKGIGKGGNIPGFLAYIMLFPEEEFGLFVAVNTETDNFLESFTEELKNRFFPRKSIDPSPVLAQHDLSPFAGEYRINRYNRHTLEDIFHLINGSTTIYNVRDSALALFHNGRMNYYRPVSAVAFQHTTDPELYLIFEENEADLMKMHRNVSIGGLQIPATFEKLKWFETVEFINEYAGFFPIFLLSYLLFPLYWLFRRIKNNAEKGRHRFPSGTRLTLIAFSGLVLLSMYSFAELVKLGNELVFGVPKDIITMLNINYLIPILLLLLIYKGFKTWSKRQGNLASRIYLSLYLVAALAYSAILYQWHLVGAHI